MENDTMKKAGFMALVNGNPLPVWNTSFFHRVVAPLKAVYDARRTGARTWKVQLDHVVDCDWKQAFIEWAERRENVSK